MKWFDRIITAVGAAGLVLSGMITGPMVLAGSSEAPTAMIVTIIFGFILFLGLALQRHRVAIETQRGRIDEVLGLRTCNTCGYDLRGIDSERCPECGRRQPSGMTCRHCGYDFGGTPQEQCPNCGATRTVSRASAS